MTGSDPISDMLTRIRNASMVGKSTVSMPHSRMREAVAKKIVEAGFLSEVNVEKDGFRRTISVQINPDGQSPLFTELKRVSKPGRRVYVKANDIPHVKSGRGIVVVSTSSGVLTGEEAREKNAGGELICTVY